MSGINHPPNSVKKFRDIECSVLILITEMKNLISSPQAGNRSEVTPASQPEFGERNGAIAIPISAPKIRTPGKKELVVVLVIGGPHHLPPPANAGLSGRFIRQSLLDGFLGNRLRDGLLLGF